MDQDRQATYIKETLDGQRKWHAEKSAYNKRWYQRLRITTLIFSAIIPFLSGLIGKEGLDWLPYVIGVCGIVVTVCQGLLALNKYEENWISYRKVAENLRREKTLYLAMAGPYAGNSQAFPLLVERVGAVLAEETTAWTERVVQDDAD